MKKLLFTLFLSLVVTLGVKARQPQKGYRGFLDWSNSVRTTKNLLGDNTTQYFTGLSTSHGYQFKFPLFIGAGIDYEHCSEWDDNILTGFLNVRTDLNFHKFTPFGDLRFGYSLTDNGGVYLSPTIGYRFNWGRKVGINIGVGYTLKGYSTDIYDIIHDPDNGYWQIGNKLYTYHGSFSYFSFRLGFDF